jgi:hypothetical protein
MFGGGIHINGKTNLEIFEENMSSVKLLSIFKDNFPALHELSEGTINLQMDNHPVHNSNIVQNFLKKKKVVVIKWPPYSPDL